MAADLHFTENRLVAALVPDAGDPPTLLYLEGYLGRCSRTNYLRLYRATPTLSGWLDIPFSRVRHLNYAEPEPGESFGVNQLWLHGTALTGDGLDPVYPGGDLALVGNSDLLSALSADTTEPTEDETGGAPPPPGQQRIPRRPPPPPFRRRRR